MKKLKKTKWPSTPYEKLGAKIIKLKREVAELMKEWKERDVDEYKPQD